MFSLVRHRCVSIILLYDSQSRRSCFLRTICTTVIINDNVGASFEFSYALFSLSLSRHIASPKRLALRSKRFRQNKYNELCFVY
uniref:Uncharacterized protein n=1 Tax=Parascaris equorum TaxID=6256 RepID=A0A914RFS6_PAREQ